jgi:plasmid stability protein
LNRNSGGAIVISHSLFENVRCVLASILIRNLDSEAKELLRRRAARRGKSLEADLRETLEVLAREEAESPDEIEPFGDWLIRISRPGVDMDETLDLIRSATVRRVSFE